MAITTGSDKQIAWAKDIIAETHRIADLWIQKKMENPGNRTEMLIGKMKANLEILDHIFDAKFIIDNREKFPSEFDIANANLSVKGVAEYAKAYGSIVLNQD